MSEKIALTKDAYERILKDLVDLEGEYLKILDEFYPGYSKEREEFIDLITNYIKVLEKSISCITFEEEAKNKFPFVIIGSEVALLDSDNEEEFKYRIVSPYQKGSTIDFISFLSPLGAALLLKNEGEEVTVKAPGGVYRYRIKDIAV